MTTWLDEMYAITRLKLWFYYRLKKLDYQTDRPNKRSSMQYMWLLSLETAKTTTAAQQQDCRQ